ncbi:MAG TPA: TIGR04325 family methyltransferase [Steroidobacteraceae bacterium]
MRGITDRQALKSFIANRDQNLFYGVYDRWEEAEKAAASYGKSGYDNQESADLYRFMMRIAPHDYPALYWLARSLSEGMQSVFDVGGAIGIKFYAFKEHLSPWPSLRWRVQDVTAVAQTGRQIAQERGVTQQLDFTDQFADGDGTDVLFASGVVQYLPKRLGEMLANYQQLPRRIVVNTAAIHPQHEFFTVNSIGTAFCPYRIQTQAGFIGSLTKLGYRVKESWTNVGKPMTIPFRPDYSIADYSGYCLDLAKKA